MNDQVLLTNLLASTLELVQGRISAVKRGHHFAPFLVAMMSEEGDCELLDFPNGDSFAEPSEQVTELSVLVRAMAPLGFAMVHPQVSCDAGELTGDVFVVVESQSLDVPMQVSFPKPSPQQVKRGSGREPPRTRLLKTDISTLPAASRTRMEQMAASVRAKYMSAVH